MRKLTLAKSLLLPLFAIFLLASCKDNDLVVPPATADEAVSGFFMVDENTPISAATLEITDMEGNLLYTGITKENGNFTIEKENVPQDADKYVVTFSKEAKVIQQLKLNTLVEASKASAGKGNVFLGDEDEYNLEWTVKIVNSETKEPVQGAVFRLGTARDGSETVYEGASDAEGLITLKLISGCYYPKYTISKEGYIDYQWNEWGLRAPSAGGGKINTYELEPIFTPDGTTENKVTVLLLRSVTRQDGSIGGAEYPLCGRKVIIKGDNGFIDSGYTGVFGDANENNLEYGAGRFTFKGLKSGVYTIRHEAVVGEYETVERTVQLAGNEKDYIHLVHAENPNRCKNNVLIVKFKDENGNPITKGTAKAEAIGVTNGWGGNVTLNEDGTAVFNNVEQSEEIFWLSVSTVNKVYKRVTTKPIIFKCGETVTIEQTLVVDKECDENNCNHKKNIGINEYSTTGPNRLLPIKENLCGVKVVITGPNGFIHSEVTDSKKSGRIFLENLCPGVYTATLESDEYEPASAQFSINCWGGGTFDGANWKAYKKK